MGKERFQASCQKHLFSLNRKIIRNLNTKHIFFWHFKFWFAGELSLSFPLVLHQSYYHWEILSYNPKGRSKSKGYFTDILWLNANWIFQYISQTCTLTLGIKCKVLLACNVRNRFLSSLINIRFLEYSFFQNSL